jgi:hypothetical protein
MLPEKSYISLLLLCFIALCLPIIIVEYPPIVDYPNHLARIFLMNRWSTDPGVSKEFLLQLTPIPNVACDVVIYLLMKLFNIEIAGKIFLILLIALHVYGCHLLAKTIYGTFHWMAIPATLLFYNSTFLYGFINFTMGIGCYLVCFAKWFNWRRSWSPLRVAAIVILSVICYLAHFTSYAFLGLSCAVILASDFLKKEITFTATVKSILPLLLPIFLFLLFMSRSGEVGAIEFDSLKRKATLLFQLIRSYNAVFDAVICLLLAFWLLANEYFRAAPPRFEKQLLSISILFWIAYLLCPHSLFTLSSGDARFVIAAGILLLLSYIPARELKFKGVLLITLILLARIAFIAKTWLSLSAKTKEMVALLDTLPEGCHIYHILPAFNGGDAEKLDLALQHVVHYATLRRRCVVSSLLALPTQQPLAFRKLPGDVSDAVKEGYTYLWSYKGEPPVPIKKQLGTSNSYSLSEL